MTSKSLRVRWPGEKLYVVLDNFSPHKHPNVRAWVAANDVELVFLPTYGSWLNWIESEFAALRYFSLNGIDHRQAHRSARFKAAGGVRRLPRSRQPDEHEHDRNTLEPHSPLPRLSLSQNSAARRESQK
ncbi:transposase [Streptomyces sp. NPDC002917]|uniref:transposase n=1 Tax=Streptomyces sp. NPDC002917 TaxID=3364671 RepID=UPI00369A5BD9